ncbi:hypothetical protein ACFWOJ_36350 [Streptomyces sp. NPDC058439]|uniref:hypothetical protein n=1 Tax=Streptomyces sp. NPDC058439 TaxID=3346500 RepID=UPI00365E6228
MLGFLYADQGNRSPLRPALRGLDRGRVQPQRCGQQGRRLPHRPDRPRRVFHARGQPRGGLPGHQQPALRHPHSGDARSRRGQ